MKKYIVFIFIFYKNFAQENIIAYPPINIKTIIFQGSGDFSNIPAIKIGSSLNLEFDDLHFDEKEYSYKIIHYDPFWEKSDLIYNEYLNGFEENKILNLRASFNTFVNYTNYKLSIPNQDVSIKLSGNYLLEIIYNDKVMFSRPFVIYENIVNISGEVKRLLNADSQKQQLIFNISNKKFKIDEYNNLEIVILQNGIFQTKKTNIKPKFISKDNMKFNENDDIIFYGNNEFRNVDLKDDMGSAMGISHVKKDGILNFYLNGISPKRNEIYSIMPDINGRFLVRSLRAQTQSTEADYALVHFTIYSEFLDPNFNLYIYGSFNFWELGEENILTYNFNEQSYEASILLKQGFYDYTVISKYKNEIDYSFFDGSSYQTDNTYQIIVYYKDIFERYYKVIGFYNLDSKSIRQ